MRTSAMLSRAQNTFHYNPRLRGPVSSSIKKISTSLHICLCQYKKRRDIYARIQRGPTFTTIVLVNERICGQHRLASETPFIWRYAGVPMMAQH